MPFQFTASPSGFVDVLGPEDMPIFTRVLNDCIGSRAPRGAPAGLSTYWIDEALNQFRPHLGGHEGPVIFSGNASYLELIDGLVEARFDYDPPDSDIVDRMPLPNLIYLLEEWRAAVIELDPTASERVPPPRPAIAIGPSRPAAVPAARSRLEAHAAALSDRASLEVAEKDGTTTMRLLPNNRSAVAVVLYLGAGDFGTVALDDPACVPAEIGSDEAEDLKAIDHTGRVACEGRATAFHLGNGGCVEVRDGERTTRTWHNAWPWPGWRRRAERTEYEPYA